MLAAIIFGSGLLALLFLGWKGLFLWLLPGVPPPGPFG